MSIINGTGFHHLLREVQTDLYGSVEHSAGISKLAEDQAGNFP